MNRSITTASRRLGVIALCAFVGLGGLPMVPTVGEAAADFGAGQSARYNKNVNGDFLMVGNTVLNCSGSSCTTNSTTNDDLNMANNDPDGNGALFNGSSATFTIPSGAVVDAAYLYWGGNLGTTRSNGTEYYCSDNHAEVSNATANKSSANTVRMKVGAGAYTTVTANTVYTVPSGGLAQALPSGSSDDGLVYEGVTDVTAAFSTVAAATATTVSVANVQTMQGENCHAGWSLTVVYRFPTLNCLTGANDDAGAGANHRNDYRNVAIYDGLIQQQNGAADTTTTLSGFLTASPGPVALRLGVLAWEGDQFLDEDQMKVKSNLSGSSTTVNPAGPSGTDNFFDSGKQVSADHNADLDADPDSGASIAQGYSGGRGDGHGIDAKTQVVQVPGGTSSIDVTFTTDRDNYYAGQFALSSPLKCLLIVEKDQAVNGTAVGRDNSTSPSPYVKSGDLLTYTMPVRVAGDVDLNNVTISDSIPAGTTFVPGSLSVGKGQTSAAALAALASGGSFGSGTVTANLGTLNNLTGASCAGGELCFGVVRFDVTVNAGVAPGTVITNVANATFTASGIAINEISNPVTDRVGALLTISKTIAGAIAGDPTTFTFTVACGGNQIAGSPVSLANGGSVTLGVTPGASCTVTEATNANFAVTVTGAIVTNGGSTTMNQDRNVAFTNTRRFAKVVVNKTTNAVAGDPSGSPTFEFTVACPGVARYPKTLNISGNGTAETPSDIPFGASCTVTEATTPGWLQSGSQSVQPVDQAAESVSFTNTRQTGSLIVNKSTVGGDGTFDFTVACDGTAWDVTRSVTTSGGTGTSTAVTGIPSGLNCTVTETVPAGWTQTAAPAGPITIVAGQQATASFTNTRQTADLVITKAVTGTSVLPVSGSFDFVADCGAAGTFSRTITASNSANGTATIAGVPVGTSCTITEAVPAGWTLDGSVAGNVTPRQITVASQGNNVTFSNRRDVGTITISKTIDQGAGTFRFDLTCGGAPVPGSPFDITINAPSTAGSVTVSNVPTGSNCVVDENPNGSVSGDFFQVTPAANGTVGFPSTGAAQTASYVDHRRVGDLLIGKVFPPNSLGDPDQVFTFQWDCGPQPRTIGLKAGQQHTVSGIPTGTACTVSETANAGYSSAVAPAGGAVTIADGTNTVTFTNTRKTGTLELRKELVPSTDPGRFDLDIDGGPHEVAGVGDDGTTGERTVPVGSHSIAETVAAGNAANLSDYTTTVACVDTAGTTPVLVTKDDNVVVDEGAKVVCTFTNTRKTGNLTLTKTVVDPLNSGHSFDLRAGGATVVAGATNGSTGSTTVNTGPVTVSEAGGDLGLYSSAIVCNSAGQPIAAGTGTSLTVNVTAGADIVCTFTNTRSTGTLEVRKQLSPPNDPGTFDLSIDGTVRTAGAGHNGTTGPVVVAAGTHSVAEAGAGASGTSLADYAAALSCIDTAHGSTAVAVSDGTVQVDPGDAVVCTFTNTRSTGGLTLRKVVVDPVGSNHTFDLLAGADVVVDEAVDGSTGTTTVNSGPVTVSETSGALGRYTTAIACTSGGQPLASGGGTSLTVEVSAGSNVVCTFTNTRRTGTLEVRKQLVPTNDPGTFDLSIDGTVRTAGAGHNGTTGAVTVAQGPHSVAEAGAADTKLGDYAASLSCVDSANGNAPVIPTAGSVQVDAGDAVVCTFTNTRTTGNLTLTKVVVDPLASSHTFDLLAGAKVVVDEAVNGSTGSTTVNTGPVTVSESGANLGQYATSIVCTEDGEPVARANDASSLQIDVEVGANVVCTFTNTRRTGTIEVRKQLVPANDPATFDLSIDGTVRTVGAGHNGTTGAIVVIPGVHAVAEKGSPTNASLDYLPTLACRETVTNAPLVVTNGAVAVASGDVVVCTFTNTRATVGITVEKVVVDPLESGHTFDLLVDDTVIVDDAVDGSSGTTTVDTGSVTVSETGADLDGYDSAIACTAGGTPIAYGFGASLDIMADGSGAVVCTFTNTRRTGTLEVRKQLSPTDDPGTFDLSVDGTVRTAAASHNGTTGAVTVAPGIHAIAEAAAGSTPGGEYSATVACIDTADEGSTVDVEAGNVEVSADAAVVCTFTNTRKAADLTITKSPGSSTVLPGGVATFSITVTNAAGGGTAHDAIVNDPLPAGVDYLASQGGVCGETGTSCSLGDIAPGTSVTFTISYAVGTSPSLMVVHNEATVTSPDDPTSPGDDADIPVARLRIEKSGDPGSYASAGDVLTYTYVVTNVGGAALTGVTVADDRIPLASIDCNGDGPGNGQPFAMAAGVSVTCTAADAVSAADLTEDSVDNVATADSDQTPPVIDTWSIPRAALSIDKVATSTGPYALGDTITYAITVTNTGVATLNGVRIEEAGVGAVLSSGCAAAPSGPGVTLASGEKLTCAATHVVTQADFNAGSYVNTAVASSDETPDVSDAATVPTPDPAVDLAIVKALTSSSLVAGQEATYSLTVRNKGPATASSIKVTDTLPAGLQPLTATGSGWTCALDGTTVTCSTAATLASGTTLPAIVLTVAVAAGARGTITNTGTVGSTQVDRDATNNTSSVTNPVTVVESEVQVPTTTTTTTSPPAVRRAVETRPSTGSPLATTGTTVSVLLLAAGLAMVAGALVLAVRRRRSR